MKRLLISWAIVALAIAVAVKIVPGVHLKSGIVTLLGVALVFGLVNTFIGTVVRVVSLPIRLLTVGLFSLVINAALLELTSKLDHGLTLDSFWAALLAAIVISLCTSVLSLATKIVR